MNSVSSVGDTSGTAGAAPVKNLDMAPADSLQLLYAKLQLIMSAECKVQAEKCMNQIQSFFDEQKQVSTMMELAERLKYRSNSPTAEMSKWMSERDLKPVNKDTREAWDINLKSLSNYMESVSSQQQTWMTFLQDYMGQYNSFLQGANTTLHEARNTLASLART